MSEQSQGPGWWQASDGKWYPPEQAPTGVQPTASQPPVGGPPPAGPPGGPPPGGPAPMAAAAGGGGLSAGKIVAIVAIAVLVLGGVAFALTRDSGGGGSVEAFCAKAKELDDNANLDNAFDDLNRIDEAVAAIDQLTDAAPSEIKGDMNTLNDAFKKIAGAVKSAGSNSESQLGAVLAASATIDQQKVEQATKNIEKFGSEKCGPGFGFSDSSSDDSSDFSTAFSDSFSFDSDDFSFDTDSFDSLLSEFSDLGSDFFSSDFFSSGN